MLDKQQLGINLDAAMVQNGFNIHTLATKSGLSTTCIDSILKGKANPILGTLHDIAIALGVKIIDLLKDVQCEDHPSVMDMIAAFEAFEKRFNCKFNFHVRRNDFLSNVKRYYLDGTIKQGQINHLVRSYKELPGQIALKETEYKVLCSKQ